MVMLRRWVDDAVAAGLHEPTAMVVSTVDATGRVASRTVLLKGLDERGPVFYTNYTSRKGEELAGQAQCAVHFGWYALERQVRLEGRAERLREAESDAYFASRPRGSQLGAWASPQSKVVDGPGGPGAALRRGGGPVRRGRGAAAAVLGWGAGGARPGGALAGPPQPDARPAALLLEPDPVGVGRRAPRSLRNLVSECSLI